jgi:sporulation protein YlmC with PRC-barrel domain
MAQNDEILSRWTGHDLFDINGEKIGTVEDVHYGDATGDLKWLVVDAGFLGLKKVFVPVVEVKRFEEKLTVPYTKDKVKSQPKIANEMVPSETEKSSICLYSGLDYAPTSTGPQEDCVEGKD